MRKGRAESSTKRTSRGMMPYRAICPLTASPTCRQYYRMSRATLLIEYRASIGDGFIVSIKVWQVPQVVLGSAHSFKYSLFFGRPGERLVAYDNERGKGDHRHYGNREEAYNFVSIEELMADFGTDIEKLKGTLW